MVTCVHYMAPTLALVSGYWIRRYGKGGSPACVVLVFSMVHTENGFDEEETLAFSAEELFSIVIDVEKYPEFLPWCESVRIREREEGRMLVDLVAKFMFLEGQYTSNVSFSSPTYCEPGWIHVESANGVFEFLRSKWQFLPVGDKVLVKFSIRFSFKNKALQFVFDMVSGLVKGNIINAFRDRAYQLFR